MTIVPPRPRDRGTAYSVQRHSARDTWMTLLVMVLLLTGLYVLANHYFIFPSLVSAVGALIIFGAVYLSLRRV